MTADARTFAELEFAGWQARAAEYDHWLGKITRNATARRRGGYRKGARLRTFGAGRVRPKTPDAVSTTGARLS